MNHKDQTPENDTRNAQILHAIRSHESKGRLLTGIALTISLLSIVAGIAIAWFQFAMLEPKEREILLAYTQHAQPSEWTTNMFHKMGVSDSEIASFYAHRDASGVNDTHLSQWELNRDMLHMDLTHDLGVALMLIAGAVALIGIGTIVTVIMVIVNRRITLRQINENLVQISLQLKKLESCPPPSVP